MRWSTAFLVVFLVITSACTHHTLSEDQCKAGDWYSIGLDDGSRGYATNRLAKHAEACERFKTPVKQAEYTRGWNKGVLSYCTPPRGYRAGLRGESYENVCPSNLVDAFLVEYKRGYATYSIRQNYEEMVSDFKRSMSNLADARKKLAAAKTPAERESLTNKSNDLEMEKEERGRKMRVFEMKHAAILSE